MKKRILSVLLLIALSLWCIPAEYIHEALAEGEVQETSAPATDEVQAPAPITEDEQNENTPAPASEPEPIEEPEEVPPNRQPIPEGKKSGFASAVDGGAEYYQQVMEKYQYGFDSYTDPQFLTDEYFYSQYDKETGEWIEKGLINYDDFPEMATMKEAVMEGDYEKAKELYLAYYKHKFSYTTLGVGTYVNETNRLISNLAVENFFVPNVDPVTMFKVEDEYQEYAVNVTSLAQETKGAFVKQMSLIIAALHKDGYQAVFYSKEAPECQPYLEVTVNNRTRRYEPLADTTIAAGSNANENFGSETDLLVAESYSTIGYPTTANTYTKRTAMMFDLSDIGPDDRINNATLYLTGKIEESDDPETPGEEHEFKDLVVLACSDATWEEDTVCWNSIAGNGAVSRDREFWNLGNTGNALTCLCTYYKETGLDIYAYTIARMAGVEFWLNGVNQAYEELGTLSVSSHVCDFPKSLGSYIKSPYLTPDMFSNIMKYEWQMSERAVIQWGQSEENANWGSACAIACLTSGMVYPEFYAATAPLKDGGYEHGKLGGWLAVGMHRMEFKAAQDLWPDDSSVEVPWGYTRYNCNLLFGRLNTITDMLNVDMRDYVSEEFLKNMEKYFMYFLKTTNTMPRGGGWQQGQGAAAYNATQISSYAGLIRQLDNPYLDWIISGRTEGKEPPFLSYVFDYRQTAVLRPNWKTDAVSAQINADGAQLSHGMGDDLAFNMMGYGAFLLTDPMTDGYTTSDPEDGWMHSSRAHNTIEINGVGVGGGGNVTVTMPDGTIQQTATAAADPNGSQGNMHPENREFNKVYNFLRAESVNYKKNANLQDNFKVYRDILFVEPEYFIITDVMEPEKKDVSNTYQQYWHTMPNSNMSIDPETGIMQTNFENQANVKVAQVGTVGADFTAEKQVGFYKYATQQHDYVKYDREETGTATYQTVIYPIRYGDTADISTEKVTLDVPDNKARALNLTIERPKAGITKNASMYTVIDDSAQTQRDFGNYSTDGSLAFVSKTNGKVATAILRDGTNITAADGTKLVTSETIIPDLGIEWSGGYLNLETSKSVSYDRVGTENNPNGAIGKNGESTTTLLNYPVEQALDGDLDTSCLLTVADENEDMWMMVDMGEAVKPSAIHLIDNREETSYTIYYSDDAENWRQLEISTFQVKKAGTGRFIKRYYIPLEKTRFIKVVPGDKGNIAVFELEVVLNPNTIVLPDLSIYSEDTVSSVTVNGEEVPFKQRNGVVTFIEEGEEGGSDGVVTPGTPDTPSDDHGTPEGGTSSGTGTITPNDPPSGGGSGNGGSGNGGSGGGDGGSSDKDDDNNNPATPPATKQPFEEELENHWGKNEISLLVNSGIVNGDGNTLNLKGQVTRGELAALLVRALDIPKVKYNGEFSDVDSSDWFADDIATAYSVGLLQGGGDGKVAPTRGATREELAKILCSAYAYKYGKAEINDGNLDFDDTDKISPWATDYIRQAVSLGLLRGMADNTFAPKDNVLREQAFVTLYRLLDAQLKN